MSVGNITEWRDSKLTVTLPHHDTTHRNERRGREAPLLCTEQAGNRDVPSGTELTVSLDGDTTTQIVEHEGLVGLSETELPRKTGILGTSPTRTAATAEDEDVVRLRLRDSLRTTPTPTSDTSLTDTRALDIVDEPLELSME